MFGRDGGTTRNGRRWRCVVCRHVHHRWRDPDRLQPDSACRQRSGPGTTGLDSEHQLPGLRRPDHRVGGWYLSVRGLAVVAFTGGCFRSRAGAIRCLEDGPHAWLSARHTRHDTVRTEQRTCTARCCRIDRFVSLPIAAIVAGFTLESAGWSVYSWASGAALLSLLVAFGYSWKSDSLRVGLVQRIMILVGWTWLGLLCAYLM